MRFAMRSRLEDIEDLTKKLIRQDSLIKSISKVQSLYIEEKTTEEVFDQLLKILLDYTKSEYGFIGYILKDDNGALYLKTFAITNISWNETTRSFYEEKSPYGLEFTNLDTLFGYTIKTGKPVISNDPKNDFRAGGLPEGHPNLNHYLGVPLHYNTNFIGMFGISNREGGYTEDILEELQPLINSVSQIINATLKKESTV